VRTSLCKIIRLPLRPYKYFYFSILRENNEDHVIGIRHNTYRFCIAAKLKFDNWRPIWKTVKPAKYEHQLFLVAHTEISTFSITIDYRESFGVDFIIWFRLISTAPSFHLGSLHKIMPPFQVAVKLSPTILDI